MRPSILFPAFAPLTSLPGIGARLAKPLAKLVGGEHVVDLVWHWPTGVIDRRYSPQLADAVPGRVATVEVRVARHQAPRVPRQPYRVIVEDCTGTLEIVFFHAKPDYLARLLPEGETRRVSGRIEAFGERLQMVHPDHIQPPARARLIPAVEPVYPMTQAVPVRTLLKAIDAAVARMPELPEWLDPAMIRQHGWPAWREAVAAVHVPDGEADLGPDHPARERLAYDELLANQLALALVRRHHRRRSGRSVTGDGRLRQAIEQALPFDLTPSQRQAVAEISADLERPERMHRLLQGDVGSGKTVVALFAMAVAVEAGAQAVLMAPTEILARQHYQTVAGLAAAAGIGIDLLTGREKGAERSAALARLKSGETAICVGTHALFQQDVAFHDLALAVIDEQHRFGVHQRVLLAEKGSDVDMLVMTATPIPRTLTLTHYGDLESSRLTEKPAGRKPVVTRVMPGERLEEVVAAIERALASRTKIYWVCPLVEESETGDLAAAEARYADLAARFPGRVGLVHGRLKGAEKDRVMADFAGSPPGTGIDILVATTVIEVGVDVPEASILVIEHAERFGLAQLHQLRGRIGRGDRAATCLLLYQPPLGEVARERLKVMRETTDGFAIAEADLKLRGAGDVLGTRQSGLPAFRLADPVGQGDLLETATREARYLVDRDQALKTPRGEALRTLLHLFERDAAVRLIRSG